MISRNIFFNDDKKIHEPKWPRTIYLCLTCQQHTRDNFCHDSVFLRDIWRRTRHNRELKQQRRRRRGQRQVKSEVIFLRRNLPLSGSLRFANGSKIVLKLNMQRRNSIPNGNTKNQPSSSTSCRRRRTWSFHVVVLQRTAEKCTNIMISSLNALHVINGLNRESEWGSYRSLLPGECNLLIFAQRRFHKQGYFYIRPSH